MSLRHGLLGLLNYSPYTGYDLNKVFTESLRHFWKATVSQIYRELNAMEESGWIHSQIVVQTDSPNKRLYTITDAGKAELTRWLRDDGDLSLPAVRNAFLMKLFFFGEQGEVLALERLRAYRDRNVAVLREMAAAAESGVARYGNKVDGDRPLYWRLVADYGRRAYRMNVEWAEASIAALETRHERARAEREPQG